MHTYISGGAGFKTWTKQKRKIINLEGKVKEI